LPCTISMRRGDRRTWSSARGGYSDKETRIPSSRFFATSQKAALMPICADVGNEGEVHRAGDERRHDDSAVGGFGLRRVDLRRVKAIASGNPLVIEKAQVDAELIRLTRLRSAHAEEQTASAPISAVRTRMPKRSRDASQTCDKTSPRDRILQVTSSSIELDARRSTTGALPEN